MRRASSLDLQTIAAVATPYGYGGIGVIRLSGDRALDLARQLLAGGEKIDLAPNRASFHPLINSQTGQTIDEAVITFFQAPRSFTGEDVVEISCHGSPVVLAEILRLLISFGAIPAQPGEFSLRAFLNGRLDLAQAEAINDLIHSQTVYQAQLAARQLRGDLSRQLQPLKQDLVDFIVRFESAVEFVEDDLESLDRQDFIDRLDRLADQIRRLASSYRVGRLIRAGLKLALVGRPNVGKSSLFNALLQKDRAIVTPLPGTTRDLLTDLVAINGIPVELFDTAGWRETEDPVEKLGVERTLAAASEADLIIAVLDASASMIDEDLKLIEQFPVQMLILNKCDLGVQIPVENLRREFVNRPLLSVSALTGEGISELKEAIHRHLSSETTPWLESAIITNERHFAALESALSALDRAREDLLAGFTEEVALAHLHRALQDLGVITGETLIGDIINQIFATFCIGK